jgi:hypothetical protein
MQSSRSDERREFQRLLLSPAVPATLGTTNVTIIEIGVLGARVVHDTPLDGDRGELRFDSNGQMISMRCEVVRTFNTDGMQSGLRFVAAIGDSGDRLREMLGQLVTRELDERRDATQGTMLKAAIDGDKTVRGKDAGFVCYRLENSGWTRRRVFLPEQPSSGFTVARNEDHDEMQRLCSVYQASDEEGRRLITLFAELSVSGALEIPPRV